MSDQILNTILDKLESLESKMESMELKMESMESKMESMESKMKSLETKMESLESEVKEIKSHTVDIPYIKQAVLETNDIVKRIEASQERHERILELLSVRSIEQEAELKRLK